MRLLWGLLLAGFVFGVPIAAVGNEAAAAVHVLAPEFLAPSQAVLPVKLLCGMHNGSWGCDYAPGGLDLGKSRTPGEPAQGTGDTTPSAPSDNGTGNAWQSTTTPQTGGAAGEGAAPPPGEHACPAGYTVLAVPGKYGYCQPPEAPVAASVTCQHGMVATASGSCRCPASSELLGGNCVHYTAICRQPVAAGTVPQACQGADEKLVCKPRPDGLQSCCCLTYDKM